MELLLIYIRYSECCTSQAARNADASTCVLLPLIHLIGAEQKPLGPGKMHAVCEILKTCYLQILVIDVSLTKNILKRKIFPAWAGKAGSRFCRSQARACPGART